MEFEGHLEALRSVAGDDSVEVSIEFIAIVGMDAVSDDFLGPFGGVLATKVGDALLGDDNLDAVFAVVHVTDERDNGADVATLGDGRAGEDRDEGIPGEIPGATDAVHEVVAHEVGRVHVAENIDLDGGVDGDDPEAADDFRIVGNLLRTKDDAILEVIQVGIHLGQDRRAEGEGGAAGEGDISLLHEADDGVLHDFREELKWRDLRVASHGPENGVGDVADAGLDGEKLFRNASGAEFRGEEGGDVLANLQGGGVGLFELGDLVGQIGSDDPDDLAGIDAHGATANAVVSRGHRNGQADGGIVGFIDVVDAPQTDRVELVEFDEDFVGFLAESGSGSDRGGENNLTIGGDVAGLHDGEVEFSEKAVADVLRQHREVHVEEVSSAFVDGFAEGTVRLIGGAPGNGVGTGKFSIERVARGGAGDDANFEFPSGRMFLASASGNGFWDGLGRPGGGESAESDGHAVLDICGGFTGTQFREVSGLERMSHGSWRVRFRREF